VVGRITNLLFKKTEIFLLTSKGIVLAEIKRNVKVKFTLEQATKAHRGNWRCSFSLFFGLGATWLCVVKVTSRPLYPRGKTSGTHFIGGWVYRYTKYKHVQNLSIG